MPIQLFDAHCHLQDKRIVAGAAAVVLRASAAGVARINCCGSAEDDWESVREISRTGGKGIVPSYGVHPWYEGGRTRSWLTTLESYLVDEPGACVGEIGLDYALEKYDVTRQIQAFGDQLDLACQLNRPVSIHCRKAWDDLFETIGRIGLPGRGAMVHSFSGGPSRVAHVEKLGLDISFSGSITRDRNRRAHESAAMTSAGHLLIETDSPDMAPGGGLNEPANLVLVCETLAKIRGWTLEQTASLTFENGKRLFEGI